MTFRWPSADAASLLCTISASSGSGEVRGLLCSRGRRGRRVRDGGTVTAEAAVLLPGCAILLALLLWAVGAVGVQLQCIDASRTAARALARGEQAERALAAGRAVAPRGAAVELSRRGDLIVVRVGVLHSLPGPWSDGLGLEIASAGVAAVER